MGSEQRIVAAEAGPFRRLLTVQGFLTLDDAGAFEGLGHVELIEREIFVRAHSLPEADIAIADIFSDKLVTAPVVRVMIEVSDSSLRHDLGAKLKLYAAQAFRNIGLRT